MSQQDVDEQKARKAAHGGQSTGPGDSPTFAGGHITGDLTVDGIVKPRGGVRAPNDLYLDAETGVINFRPGLQLVDQIHLDGKTDVIWGDVEALAVGRGVVVKSPNGTRYRLTPSDAGASVWTAI